MIKKAAATMVALMMVLAFFAVPVSADEVVTTATIQSGGGDPPWVMAVWQQDGTPELEDGDPTHQVDLPQFMPPIVYEGTKTVYYFAVVYDAQGPDTITEVSNKVYYPLGNEQGLEDEGSVSVWNEWTGLKKYQVISSNSYLTNDEVDKANARAALQAAYLAGLVTFNDATWEEIDYKLSQDEAKLFWGSADKYYKQPGGWYPVETFAFDNNDNPSAPVSSKFYYVPVAAFELDFASVNYGAVSINNWKPISGDATFDPPESNRPTIRNIGNTWMSISIEQDDMGIGTSLVNGQTRWDVTFGARLGDNSNNWVEYDPYQEITLPNPLPLCNTMKLDFKIKVLKAISQSTHIGEMTITADPWWGDNGIPV